MSNPRQLFFEMYQCINDCRYFINSCKVLTPNGIDPFVLKEYQKTMLDIIEDSNQSIFLAARQTGKSTVPALYFLWLGMFSTEPKNILIVANKQSSARSILNTITFAYEQLPAFLKDRLTNNTRDRLDFLGGTNITATTYNVNALCGRSVSHVLLDEFAFVDNAQSTQFYESMIPTIHSSNGKIIITSSANKTTGKFYELWKGATGCTNNYVPMQINWDVVPGRDVIWKNHTIQNIGMQAFMTEYDNKFIPSVPPISTIFKLLKNGRK